MCVIVLKGNDARDFLVESRMKSDYPWPTLLKLVFGRALTKLVGYVGRRV
jgi:hypothetical protein